MSLLKKSASLLCLLALPVRFVSAVELSLEENRAQRGNIGYIDMQKVFRLFPETARAKENFAEVVRQAEEQLNTRKAEILRLRAELSQLKYDRSESAKTPVPAPPPAPAPAPPAPVLPLPVPAPAAALPPATTSLAGVAVSTDAPIVTTYSSPTSTTVLAASTASLISNLPGLTTQAVAPPLVEPKKGLLAYSDTPAPAISPARFAEIDAKIESKSLELSQKEKSFKEHQNEVEKNLLDLEGRRSEILLGKIHRVVKEVALKEGVSVVVDKGAILYGQDAVDLTDRVLKALKGS